MRCFLLISMFPFVLFLFFKNFWGIFLIPTTFTHIHDPQLPPTTHDLRKSAILPVLSNRILCLMILSYHHYTQFTNASPPNGTLWWICFQYAASVSSSILKDHYLDYVWNRLVARIYYKERENERTRNSQSIQKTTNILAFGGTVFCILILGASSVCVHLPCQIKELFGKLGLQSSPEKDCPPFTWTICLGRLIDT